MSCVWSVCLVYSAVPFPTCPWCAWTPGAVSASSVPACNIFTTSDSAPKQHKRQQSTFSPFVSPVRCRFHLPKHLLPPQHPRWRWLLPTCTCLQHLHTLDQSSTCASHPSAYVSNGHYYWLPGAAPYSCCYKTDSCSKNNENNY